MIQSAQDAAEFLAHAVRKESEGEACANEPRVTRFVTPPVVLFLITTVEGRQFSVTVQEATA